MGLDLQKPRKNHFDRNKWYKREYVNNMKLIQGAAVSGVFYSTDKDAISIQTIFVGNIKKTTYTITIITHDNVAEMEMDDYVLYNNELWLVDNILSDDDNKAKQFSSRASRITEILLRK
jgi:hypothetical protein